MAFFYFSLLQKRLLLSLKKQDVTQTECNGHLASGAGRKAKGRIVAIEMFLPCALRPGP